MQARELTLGEQYAGLRTGQRHVVALAARAALNIAVLSPYSFPRQLAGCGFAGRSAMEIVRGHLEDPQPAMDQATVVRQCTDSLCGFVDQPLRDEKLTRHKRMGTQNVSCYRQRVITPGEAAMLVCYSDMLGGYAQALAQADADSVFKQAREMAAMVNPEAWFYPKSEHDLLPTAAGIAAYLGVYIDLAVETHGPAESWPRPPDAPLPAGDF